MSPAGGLLLGRGRRDAQPYRREGRLDRVRGPAPTRWKATGIRRRARQSTRRPGGEAAHVALGPAALGLDAEAGLFHRPLGVAVRVAAPGQARPEGLDAVLE